MNGAQPQTRSLTWLWGVAFLILGLCGGMLVSTWVMALPETHLKAQSKMNVSPGVQTVALRPGAYRMPARTAAPRTAAMQASFEKEMTQLLEVEHNKNLAALDSARRRLDDKFRSYDEKVPQFARELNSLSIKFRIAKALVQDKVQSGQEMKQLVADLFAKEVLPDSQLHADMQDLAAQFYHDLDANREMVSLALGRAVVLPSVTDATAASGLELLARESREKLDDFLGECSDRIPNATLSALANGVVAEEAVRRLVTDAIAKHSAESSGEAAKNPDGTPSVTPKNPDGTPSKSAQAAGIAAGVLAGAADYWLLQSRFEAALTKECRTGLAQMRETLWSDPHNGLEAQFTALVELVNVSHRIAMQKAMAAGAQ